LLRTPAAAPALFAVTQLGPEFFRARNGAGKTLLPKEGANPGEHLSHWDLPRMTGYRVRDRPLT